jgi:hypothetical protein
LTDEIDGYGWLEQVSRALGKMARKFAEDGQRWAFFTHLQAAGKELQPEEYHFFSAMFLS